MPHIPDLKIYKNQIKIIKLVQRYFHCVLTRAKKLLKAIQTPKENRRIFKFDTYKLYYL